jgi:hypothetical protein
VIQAEFEVHIIEPLRDSIAKSYDMLAAHQQVETIIQLYNISTQSLNIPSSFKRQQHEVGHLKLEIGRTPVLDETLLPLQQWRFI